MDGRGGRADFSKNQLIRWKTPNPRHLGHWGRVLKWMHELGEKWEVTGWEDVVIQSVNRYGLEIKVVVYQKRCKFDNLILPENGSWSLGAKDASWRIPFMLGSRFWCAASGRRWPGQVPSLPKNTTVLKLLPATIYSISSPVLPL